MTLKELLKKHKGNKAAAARELGMARTTFRETLEKEGVGENLAESKMKFAYQLRIKNLEGQLKEAIREQVTADEVRAFIFALNSQKPSPPSWTFNTKYGGGFRDVPTLFLSDFHWGETVEAGETNGLNVYNLEVAEKRLEKIGTNFLDLSFNHFANPEYPGLVLLLGGDMVSGSIHDELDKTNAMPMLAVVLHLKDRMIAFIDLMLTEYDEVLVLCEYGNHGRQTIKRAHKLA